MANSSRRYGNRHSRPELPPTTEDLIERAVNEARKLPSYEANDEESTARHAIPQNLHFNVHVTQPSQPDHDSSPELEVGPVKLRGFPKLAIAAVGIVIAAVTAIASHFAAKGH